MSFFIISGLIFWVVQIQVLNLYRGGWAKSGGHLTGRRNGDFFENYGFNPCLTRKMGIFCRNRRFLVG